MQKRLLSGLERLLTKMAEFRSILEQEAEYLSSVQTEELSELSQDKLACMASLQETTSLCHQEVEKLGFPGNAAGLTAFMESNKPEAELCRVWHLLKEKITICAEINQTNERLNQNGQERIQKLLRLLRGQSADPLTYEELIRR